MRIIYTFVSEAPHQISAFTGDRTGASLPARHGPWRRLEEIGPKKKIPHQFDRAKVERAIDEHGYQLWRLKKQP